MKSGIIDSQAEGAKQDKDQKTYLYKVFGLNISSWFEIPELIPTENAPEVHIRLGKVPDSLEEPCEIGVRFQAKPNNFLLKKDNIAKYLVLNGDEIIIEKLKETPERELKVFLLGSAMAALLHQRGIFPIHASAIKVKDQCVLFCGPSGYGKSAIATAFIERGYDLHADDICAVSIDSQGIPLVYPGYPQMKLWEDTLKKNRKTPNPYPRVRHHLRKFAVPVKDQFNDSQLAIKKIYLLSPYNGQEIKLRPVTGIEKFSALKNQTYRKKFTVPLGKKENRFKVVCAIGKHAPVCFVKRPQKPFLLDELADLLEQDFLA